MNSRSNKLTLAICAAALTLGIAACGGGDAAAPAATDAPTTTPASTAAPTTAAPTTAAPDTAAPDAAAPDTSAAPTASGDSDGMALYEANCARCHGGDGGGGRGPSLQGIATEQPDPQAAIDTVIAGGRGMPSFGDKLTIEEITATVTYLREAFPAPAS